MAGEDGETGSTVGTASTGETSSGETSSGDGDGDGDGETTGSNACAPTPTRFIVLGDSVAAGVGTSGPSGDTNAFKMMQQYVADNFADASLTFENYSVGGAVTTDVPDNQIGNIPTGMPGHVLVNIHVGGNDLQPFLPGSDQNAVDAFPGLIADGLEDWETIWAFFEDPANFPDGATVVVNTQYNPFDDCDASYFGFSLSDVKTGLLQEYNQTLRDEVALRDNGIIADQHPVFLGHGHHYNKPECASYLGPDADYWMVGGADFIHANETGHVDGMSAVFRGVAEELYANCN